MDYSNLSNEELLKLAEEVNIEIKKEEIKCFQTAVRIGDEQIANGETIPYSKDLIDKTTKSAIKRFHKKK